MEETLREMSVDLPLTSVGILQYFSTTCLKRTLLMRCLNENMNVSSRISNMTLNAINLSVSEVHPERWTSVNLSRNRNTDMEFINRDVLPHRTNERLPGK